MATLKKYDFEGKEIGEVAIEDKILEVSAHPQMVKDYLIAIRENFREWHAHTKGRSEVNHTGRKPHPQKGQGRARQGCLAAPQYKGGGRVFAPRTKFNQHVSINKKEKKAAIYHLLAEKIVSSHMHVVCPSEKQITKTKQVANLFDKIAIRGRRVLVLLEDPLKEEKFTIGKHDGWIRSMKNLPKVTNTLFSNVNGYELALSEHVVVTEEVLQELIAGLRKASE